MRLKPDGTRWRTVGEVKGKLANGVGSQYSHTTSERGVSSITNADAHTSAASSRLNWRPHRFKWTRPFRRKTKSGFSACAITFQTHFTSLRHLHRNSNSTGVSYVLEFSVATWTSARIPWFCYVYVSLPDAINLKYIRRLTGAISVVQNTGRSVRIITSFPLQSYLMVTFRKFTYASVLLVSDVTVLAACWRVINFTFQIFSFSFWSVC